MKGKKLRLSGRSLSTASSSSIRPYTLRVHRDHGGGLWSFEDNTGQLYLAVQSREWTDEMRARQANKQATGEAYRH